MDGDSAAGAVGGAGGCEGGVGIAGEWRGCWCGNWFEAGEQWEEEGQTGWVGCCCAGRADDDDDDGGGVSDPGAKKTEAQSGGGGGAGCQWGEGRNGC